MKKYLLLILIPFALFSCKKAEKVISTEDQAKLDKEIIQQYIRTNSLIADSTATGLYYVIADSGSGANPNINSLMNVYYKGYLTNASVFDQNAVGQPLQILLNRTILGWQQGVPLIKKNGRIKLLIPSALGYGTSVQTGIPASSVLIFDIELDSFQ